MNTRGSVIGFVSNARDSAPVCGAMVFLVGKADSVTTDSTGFFRLADIPSGEQMFHIKKEHYTSVVLGFVVPDNATALVDTLYLYQDYGILAGALYNAGSGAPISQASIFLVNSHHTLVDSTKTNTAGNFMFNYVIGDSSEYFISMEKPMYRKESFVIRVLAGDSIFIADTLLPLTTKTFVICDLDARTPVKDAAIRCNGIQTLSDSFGRVILPDWATPDTGVQCTVAKTYFQTLVFRDTTMPNEPPVDTVFITRLTGSVIGIFRLQGRRDCADIIVRFPAAGFADTTDSEGAITIANVPAGIQFFIASKPGFASLADSVEIPGQGTALFEKEMIVQSGVIQTSVDWFANGSPYTINGHLEVGEGAALVVHAGVEVLMANGSQLFSSGSGILQFIGGSWGIVRISSDSTSGEHAAVEIRDCGGNAAAIYTMFKDVEVVLKNGPSIEHCLFVHTSSSETDTSVRVLPWTRGTRFNQCDFISMNGPCIGVYIHDSAFAVQEDAETVVFSNCIFSQLSPSAVQTPFLVCDNSGNIRTRLAYCNFFANGTMPVPWFGIERIDTVSIGSLEPGYTDPEGLVFYLNETSGLIDKSMSGNYIGAMGVAPPDQGGN